MWLVCSVIYNTSLYLRFTLINITIMWNSKLLLIWFLVCLFPLFLLTFFYYSVNLSIFCISFSQIQLYSFLIYIKEISQHTWNPDVMTKLSFMLAYSWKAEMSKKFTRVLQCHGFYSFSALHNSQIWIKSIPKHFYITSLLGQNFFASKWICTLINYKHSFNRNTPLNLFS